MWVDMTKGSEWEKAMKEIMKGWHGCGDEKDGKGPKAVTELGGEWGEVR
jgi:hypothetical protein